MNVSGVSDGALVHLRNLKHLTILCLGGRCATDQGLEHLKDLTQLELLQIGMDPPVSHVTNDGLLHLAGLKNLTQLSIENSPDISDEGLVHLQGLAKLKCLMVRGTNVTFASSIRKKIPSCQILYPVLSRKRSTKIPAPGDV